MHYFKMAGKEVFKYVDLITAAAKETFRPSWNRRYAVKLVPHQANIRIMEALSKGFNVSDSIVFKTIHKYGNTSASGVGSLWMS